jgi:hypothetical protein
MKKFHVRVVGGTCGGAMYVISESLGEYLAQRGYDCRITQQDICVSRVVPPGVDLLLEVVPTFTVEEAGCPIISARPMLLNLRDAATLQKIMAVLERSHPAGPLAGATEAVGWPVGEAVRTPVDGAH